MDQRHRRAGGLRAPVLCCVLDRRLKLRVGGARRLAPTTVSITTAGASALAIPWVFMIEFLAQA